MKLWQNEEEKVKFSSNFENVAIEVQWSTSRRWLLQIKLSEGENKLAEVKGNCVGYELEMI